MVDDFATKTGMNKIVFYLFLTMTIIILVLLITVGVNAFMIVGDIVGGLSRTLPLPIVIIAFVLLILALNTKHREKEYY